MTVNNKMELIDTCKGCTRIECLHKHPNCFIQEIDDLYFDIAGNIIYPKYQEAYDSYVKISKQLGNTIDFTYEQYLELVLKNK